MRKECWLSNLKCFQSLIGLNMCTKTKKWYPLSKMQKPHVWHHQLWMVTWISINNAFFFVQNSIHIEETSITRLYTFFCVKQNLLITMYVLCFFFFCRWHSSPYWHKRNSRFRKTHCSFSARLSAGRVYYTWHCSKTAPSKFNLDIKERNKTKET